MAFLKLKKFSIQVIMMNSSKEVFDQFPAQKGITWYQASPKYNSKNASKWESEHKS